MYILDNKSFIYLHIDLDFQKQNRKNKQDIKVHTDIISYGFIFHILILMLRMLS